MSLSPNDQEKYLVMPPAGHPGNLKYSVSASVCALKTETLALRDFSSQESYKRLHLSNRNNKRSVNIETNHR